MYTIKDEAGNFLKYVFKDRVIFNGGTNARSIVVYKCKKHASAEKLLQKCLEYGFKNIEIVEITDDEISAIPKPKAPTKEQTIKLLNKNITKDELEEYYNDEDEIYDPDYLWKDINEKCKSCKRQCKQSWKAIIYRCPQFDPIN